MVTEDYSRAAELNLIIKNQRLVNPVLTLGRSDSVGINYSADTIIMTVMSSPKGTPIVTISTESELTMVIDVLSIDYVFTELKLNQYYHEIYNYTRNESIAAGIISIL